jgi:ParB family chromosome partitioning protein
LKIAIADIKIGERRREDLGNIDELAASINAWGLLHPIVVDDQNRLVAGERRLRACQQLGWREIEVTLLANLSTDDLREIELEENIRRKDLTTLELSKNMVELAKLKAEKAKTCLKTNFESRVSRGDTRINPILESRPDSTKAIAKEIGVPRSTLIEAQQHVAAAEEFPELAPLPKKEAITIAKQLRSMPPEEREEKLETMRTVQDNEAKNEKRLDVVYRVKNKYRDALSALPTFKIDDDEMEMWLESMDRDDMDLYLDWIHTSRTKLDVMEGRLRNILKGPRPVKPKEAKVNG